MPYFWVKSVTSFFIFPSREPAYPPCMLTRAWRGDFVWPGTGWQSTGARAATVKWWKARVAGSPAHGRRGSTRALVPSRRPAIHHPPLCSALHGWLGTSAGTRGGDGRPAGRTATLPFSFFPVGLARGGGAPGAWSDRGGSRSRGKAGRKGAGRSPGVGRPGAAHSATRLGAPRRAAHNFPRGDATGGRDPVATADANRVVGFGFSRERNYPWRAARPP